MKEYKNAITLAKGFRSQAIEAGIKKSSGLDLALIYSDVPASACGMFTKNKFAAAPVELCREYLKSKKAQAIIVNSGNANCYTGKPGMETAKNTTCLSAELLGIDKKMVLVASTGIIGRPLDFSKIKKALPSLVGSLDRSSGNKTAQAIMTTDTKPKALARELEIGGKKVTIGAIAKGAGMIAPDMATMLCFITTDVLIEYSALKEALKQAVEYSFNMITIDGCMSTNDSVIILANGLAENKKVCLGTRNFSKFKTALSEICLGLAKMIILDAEGASKFITIQVSGAKDNTQAKKAALAVANSNLFKTAVYGGGANWGRIVAAVGASGVEVREKIKIEGDSFRKKDIIVKIDLRLGRGKAVVYTSDLTPEYIRINAKYN
ncbi:MAG: bifunctional glutamate N-acetyltransferase/amino-acid acetyltransferase ArgJ [Candidatus Omnitrophota bacterium]|nr:bifunctional glutamate N-acetyltransferase/amino-acid acetyltransferase ArgJ [Candidatus Omnitrophota bacterium]